MLYTNTAVANEATIDNFTNKTITSTVQGTSFPPFGVIANETAIVREKPDGTTLYI